ncbi:MAG: tetratricopeptide repeat protein [Bacteroidales bacterium]|nr:tetratricopeptide repeat protein [Bacteroidales bacterium]
MAYEWFISYRRKTGGENQARQVAEILAKYVGKDKVFYDRESMREGNWRDQINDALKTAEHFVLLVNEASAAEDQSNNIGGYRYEIETALKLNKKITLIEYDKKSYDEVIKKYPQLPDDQKVTFNGEYNFAFEERLCKHFGFVYQKPSSAQTVIHNIVIPENLIQRRDMLDKLDNEFKSHKCVVVSGIGGSGKTSLAYLYAKEQKFNNIAWVIVNGKIEDVFVDRIARLLFKNEDYEGFSRIDDAKTKLDIIKSELSKIEGNNLLVFDINTNTDEIKKEIETKINNYLPSGSWKTLVLTRTVAENPSRFVTIKMDRMAEGDAQKLFLNNWTRTKIVFSQDQLAEIAKELYYHPLLIEQTAIVFSKGYEKSADEIISKIKENSKVNNPRTKKILSGLAIEDKEQQDIYTYLINLCNIENLSTDEINFLAVYVTWPEEPIDYEVISTLLPKKIALPIVKEMFENSDDEDMKQMAENNLNEGIARAFIKFSYENAEDEDTKQSYKELIDKCTDEDSNPTLDSLVEKGIISRNDDQFSIHSLMADVIREQINISEFDYTDYLDNVRNILRDNIKKVALYRYSKCIASGFINYGICGRIALFINFLNQLRTNNDVILYQLPMPELYHLANEFEKNTEPYYLAGLYNSIAKVEEFKNNFSDAKMHYEKALEVIEGAEENEKILDLKGGLLHNLAGLEEHLGDTDSAKKHYEEALEIGKKLPETPANLDSLARTLGNLAVLEKKLGETDSAKKHLEEAIEIGRKLPETPQYLDLLSIDINNLALLEKKLGDTESAKKHYEEAVEVKRKLLELTETPRYLDSLAVSLTNLADLEENLGDTDSAKMHFEEAVEIYRQLPETPVYVDNLTNSLAGLAKLEAKLGDIDSAKKHLEEGLEISSKIGNEEDINFFEKALSYFP